MTRRAVLLVNLGSPDSTSVGDVRRYLREFLMDGRVLDAPWPIRFAIVHFGILPGRPKESAHAYSKIWTDEGSPLVATGRRVQSALREKLQLPVELAMRYRQPSIESAIASLRDQRIESCLVIPLFPHYAMSSYETAVVRVREVARRVAPRMTIEVVPPFFEDEGYVRALVATAKGYLGGDYDHLLFSFHGVPERHLRKGDPSRAHCLAGDACCEGSNPAHATCYRAQCFRTVSAFVRATPVKSHSVAFQSRLGRDPWIKPYTDMELQRLAAEGKKRLLVMCPAFVADCLETIEEIGLRGRETFRAAGGEELTLIPCLNDHPAWIDALAEMSRRRNESLPASDRRSELQP